MAQKKSKVLKKVLLGLFFVFGTIIIAAAVMVVLNFVLAKNVDSRELTKNLSDFTTVYDEFSNQRDLPDGLAVSDATCVIKDSIYTVTVKLKNTTSIAKSIAFQLYFNDSLVALKPSVKNPFVSVKEDDALMLAKNEEKEFTVTGTIGSDISAESFASAMEYIYLEVLYANDVGRVMLPVIVTEK